MSGARDQIARMMALVPYLNGKEIPLAEVAELFGVTPKRIVDDLNVLYWCGLPGLMPGVCGSATLNSLAVRSN